MSCFKTEAREEILEKLNLSYRELFLNINDVLANGIPK